LAEMDRPRPVLTNPLKGPNNYPNGVQVVSKRTGLGLPTETTIKNHPAHRC